ncbi:hypothetical protein bcgnr5369_44100 [Bacillus cereus]
MSMLKFHISTVKELQSGYYIEGIAINLEDEKYFGWDVKVNRDIQIEKHSSILEEKGVLNALQSHLVGKQYEITSRYYQMVKKFLHEQSENKE